MPTFRVEFYRPFVLNAGISFSALLGRILAMNAVQRIRQGNDPAALLTLQQHDNEYVGEAARIRMEDLPSVIDVATGDRHDLNVRIQEGLGEEIHFLYDAGVDVLAVQSKLHFRASALQRLMSDLTGTSVDFQIILRADAWRRFQDMESVTKINFKLARPRDIEGQLRPAVTRIFHEIDEFNGVAAKVEITVGRRGRGLSLAAIARLITDFTAVRDNFKALSITGTMRALDAAGQDFPQHETVDFVKERLVFSAEVDRRGRSRRLDAEGCRLALRRAIREHREYLRR